MASPTELWAVDAAHFGPISRGMSVEEIAGVLDEVPRLGNALMNGNRKVSFSAAHVYLWVAADGEVLVAESAVASGPVPVYQGVALKGRLAVVIEKLAQAGCATVTDPNGTTHVDDQGVRVWVEYGKKVVAAAGVAFRPDALKL